MQDNDNLVDAHKFHVVRPRLVLNRPHSPEGISDYLDVAPFHYRAMQSVLHKIVGPREVQPDNLTGRVAVVTGGALGIGYEISRALAHAGCTVIMVNRKEDQGQAAIDRIKEESPEAKVDWKECDLGNLAQIRTIFSNIRDSIDRLDYLVLSAGINANQYGLDFDGIERVFAVNYLGHYYVTNQLWPKLRATSLMPGVTGPRVVAISSEVHRAAPSHVKFQTLDDVNNPNLSPTELYGRSKLALILFVKYGLLESVVKPTSDSIYALAVHPGAVSCKCHRLRTLVSRSVTG